MALPHSQSGGSSRGRARASRPRAQRACTDRLGELQTDLTKPDPIGMGSYNSDSQIGVHEIDTAALTAELRAQRAVMECKKPQ